MGLKWTKGSAKNCNRALSTFIFNEINCGHVFGGGKLWNFITSPRRNEEKEVGDGQVPGARCEGTPNHHGDGGHGGRSGEGRRGRARAPSSRAARLWHESPPPPHTHTPTRWFGDAGGEVAYAVALKRTPATLLLAFSTNRHSGARRAEELGQLQWSNRSAPSAAGH